VPVGRGPPRRPSSATFSATRRSHSQRADVAAAASRSLSLEAARSIRGDLVGIDLLPPQNGFVVVEVNGAVDFRPGYGLRPGNVFRAAVHVLVRVALLRRVAAYERLAKFVRRTRRTRNRPAAESAAMPSVTMFVVTHVRQAPQHALTAGVRSTPLFNSGRALL
jgi:hypothetical protein